MAVCVYAPEDDYGGCSPEITNSLCLPHKLATVVAVDLRILRGLMDSNQTAKRMIDNAVLRTFWAIYL